MNVQMQLAKASPNFRFSAVHKPSLISFFLLLFQLSCVCFGLFANLQSLFSFSWRSPSKRKMKSGSSG